MTAPDPPKKRYRSLGLAAYLLVPGERRVQAARHFGRAGIEALRGVRALVTPERERQGASRREHIEIE